MGQARSNFGPKTASAPKILQDRKVVDAIAAQGSFIFVKAGSLFKAAQELGIEVRAD